MLSQVRSCPFGEEWFSHSRLYKPSDRRQKGNSAYESPPLQVQVCGLWLGLSGADILCPRQSQLHSSLCQVCGRSIEGNDPQRHSPSFGCVVGHDQRDSHSTSCVSLCSTLSWGSGQHRHRRVCRSKRACVKDHCRWPQERSDSPCGSGQGGRCFGRILEKGQTKEVRHQVYRHRSLCRFHLLCTCLGIKDTFSWDDMRCTIAASLQIINWTR